MGLWGVGEDCWLWLWDGDRFLKAVAGVWLWDGDRFLKAGVWLWGWGWDGLLKAGLSQPLPFPRGVVEKTTTAKPDPRQGGSNSITLRQHKTVCTIVGISLPSAK